MTKKVYLETLKSVLGRSILRYPNVEPKSERHTKFQDFLPWTIHRQPP